MDESRVLSRYRSTFAVAISAATLVALALALLLVGVGMVVHLQSARVHRRQTTLMDWQEANAVSDVLVGSALWRVSEVLPPCGDANPESLIVLTATKPGAAPIAALKAETDHLAWKGVETDDPSAPFSADSSSGRVHVWIETAGKVATAELSVTESCR